MQKQVLVIDDDADIRYALRTVLEEEGFEVTCAEDGGRGLSALTDAIAHEAPPDVIVLDLMMPNMSGWELLRVRRERIDLSAIPVVVLTAADEAALPSADLVEACLRKPVELGTLCNVLDRLCSRETSEIAAHLPRAAGDPDLDAERWAAAGAPDWR